MNEVDLLGMKLWCVDRIALVDHLFQSLREGKGGWIVTANLDFLRRFKKDPGVRELYGEADIRVPDGMPLVWATRLQGDTCPERIAGSGLLRPIASRAAGDRRSLYLLGGEPGAADAAAATLVADYPGLVIAGVSSPWISSPPSSEELAPVRAALLATRPDIVLVGLGSPKQEQLIHALRADLPQSWWMGVGIAFSFLAGHKTRAPTLLQAVGLEWAHRLAQEPRRLARRYLIEDLPFGVELLLRAAARRVLG